LLLRLIKEYDVDGVILHRTRSCRPWSWGQVHYRTLLEKEGIPALIFESDMADVRTWSDSKVKAQVEPFIEIIAQLKYGKID
jgi:benzoyl-CoA reductase/2-hydroxyglutaryl-CoA dehydratase subunit BcrC/BadD/HgdB